MAINDEQFGTIINLIEDGEIDDRLIELQAAIDDRNTRRKEDILRLVKSVWGDDAVVNTQTGNRPNSVPPRHVEAEAGTLPQPRADYVPTDDDEEIPPTQPPGWPEPIVSMGGGGGVGMSPVRDPMGDGADEGGDDIISTGAQFQ